MKTLKQIQKQKAKLQKELKELELKDYTLIIETPFGKIEIEKQIHHNGKTYQECEEDCPEGWQIPTHEVLQWLRNSTYINKLNLKDTWEFVINPDEISKKQGAVAWFDAGSDGAYLGCYGNSVCSNGGLGVRYMRRIK